MLVPNEHLLQACESLQFPTAMTQIHCNRNPMKRLNSYSSPRTSICAMYSSRSYERSLKILRNIFSVFQHTFCHVHKAHSYLNWTLLENPCSYIQTYLHHT